MIEIVDAQQEYAGTGLEVEETSLEDIIDYALALQEWTIERHDLKINKEMGLTDLVIVQRTKLIHILINIFKNATEAMSELNSHDKKITIKTWQDEENVYLSIRDIRIGIHEKDMDKIFANSFTTKESNHGFGLHSSANHISEMSEKIEVKSEGEGKGATFILTFPRLYKK